MPNPRPALLLLLLLLALPGLAGAVASMSDPERYLRTRDKPMVMDRETLKRELTDTLGLVEALALQLATASPAEAEEVWASGTRDFRLKSGSVKDCRKSAQLLMKAHALELAAADRPKAASLRADARSSISSQHKNVRETYLRDLRNWLSVSEGSLRKARDAEARAASPVSPTAKPK